MIVGIKTSLISPPPLPLFSFILHFSKKEAGKFKRLEFIWYHESVKKAVKMFLFAGGSLPIRLRAVFAQSCRSNGSPPPSTSVKKPIHTKAPATTEPPRGWPGDPAEKKDSEPRYRIVIKREKKVPEASASKASGTSLLIPTRSSRACSKQVRLGDMAQIIRIAFIIHIA